MLYPSSSPAQTDASLLVPAFWMGSWAGVQVGSGFLWVDPVDVEVGMDEG